MVRGHQIGSKLQLKEPQVLQMPWRTKNNGVDCGVFAMRHMETYMGGGLKNWKSGLLNESTDQKTQLNRLRCKYVTKIIKSEVNLCKDDILREVEAYKKKDQSERVIPKKIVDIMKDRQNRWL